MFLETETVRRLAECFAGRACCRCGKPAGRLFHKRFYCDRHFPCGRPKALVPKVYRCLVG